MPKEISSYNYSNKITTTVNIFDVKCEAGDGKLIFNFSGEKTYDIEGDEYSRSCKIGYKIDDSEGYVVKTGVCYTEDLKVGDKFRNNMHTIYFDVVHGETYRIELLDVQ